MSIHWVTDGLGYATSNLLPERRSAPRYAAAWPLVFTYCGDHVPGKSVNISVIGLLFTTRRRLRARDRLKLELIPQPTMRLRFSVEIVREEYRKDGVYGYGARFVNLSDAEKQELKRYLQMFSSGWITDDSALGYGLGSLDQ